MELREYLRVLRRRWLLILGVTGVLVALAAAYTVTATPQYSSDAQVLITAANSKGSDASASAYQGAAAANQRVQTYTSLLGDGKLTHRVVDDLGLSISSKELAKKIRTSVEPDSAVLNISVVDSSRSFAHTVCSEVVRQLVAMIRQIETPQGQSTALFKGNVISSPTSSANPVSPKPLRNLAIAVVLGLLAGIAIAVARELLDTTVKSADDVEAALDAPLLGGIAHDSETAKEPLVTSLSSHAPRVEAFRVLRTNLQFVDIDAQTKSFVVTSSLPSEGKSTTAVNVALTMAQAGQRVLVVDGDLRRPQVAALLGLDDAVGVTTVLLGRIGLHEAVQRHPSGLDVLTSGPIPPNPAELLQSKAMSDLLQQLRTSYDVVVIDSPPLLPVTDAALLARQTDGAVVVVRHGKTKRDQLAAAEARLHGVDARVLGAVLNRVRKERGTSYSYGEGYGYAPTAPVAEAAAVSTSAAENLRPDTAPRADAPPTTADDGVAEVLPITGSSRAARVVEREQPEVGAGTRRAPGPAVVQPELEDTGTGGAPPPGRHRS